MLTKNQSRIVLFFLVLSLLTLATIVLAPKDEDVVVIAQSPNGNNVSLDTPISVTFSRPVDQRSAEGAFMLSPAVEGRFEWQGETLVFYPIEPLRPKTRYRVTIGAGIRDTHGRVNRIMAVSWPFRTR